MMQVYLIDWLNLALKLLHVIAGIAWIGASFYFNWLENKLDRLSLGRYHVISLLLKLLVRFRFNFDPQNN